MKTLIVNILGGPGVGKSTNASLLYGKLKNQGINAEYVSEYAKDLTWEGRSDALACQPYVTSKQLWRLSRLVGKVEVIVTDSPLLLGIVYAGDYNTKAFIEFVLEAFHRFDNFNLVLKRNSQAHKWNPEGRSQSEAEALLVDTQIREVLGLCSIPFVEVPILPGELTANHLLDMVVRRLG